jgi:hypothetical protein
MSGYFSYFPSLLYANTAAVNIIAKVQFDASVLKRSVSFYPYTVVDDQRADSIAEQYYGDPSYDWLIYLSNNIIDPHNEWPKSSNEFNDFLTLKYGNIANTQQQTAYYQVSYSFDDSVIGSNVYTALSAGQKKYWSPIVNTNDVVINYQRKAIDTVVETNQIVQLTGAFSGFSTSDVIKQSSSVMGTVSFANSSTVVLKHTSGTWATATPVYFVATGSVANATITTSSIVNQSIPIDEITYWSAVSIYESESNLNESRKHIRLLNSAYVDVVERDMKDLL